MVYIKCLARLTALAAVFVLPVSAAQADFTIVSLGGSTTVSPGNVVFAVNFAGPIAPPSAFAANSVVGYIDLDIDGNAATGGSAPWGGPVAGGNSWINFFVNQALISGPNIRLGDEFYIDIGSEEFHPGFVDIVRTSDDATVDSRPITFGSQSFRVSVPLADLPGANSIINFGIIVGDFNEPTNRAPSGMDPAQTVPEPASLLLLAIGAGVAGIYRVARRH
jgi:PEP-CTERM motif